MEQVIYNTSHHPVEYISTVNKICDHFRVLYCINQTSQNHYQAIIQYNNDIYTGTITETLEITLLHLFEQIHLILKENNIPKNILELLKFIINQCKNYISCIH